MSRAIVKVELWLAFAFGLVALSVLFAVALFAPQQNALLITVARVTLALACAGIAAIIPGFLHFQLQPTISTAVRAGGALAVFVLVYFFNPPGLIKDESNIPPPPTADYMPVVKEWLAKVDEGKFVEAYESAGSETKNEYPSEFFVSLFKTYLTPLGPVVNRKLLAANSATLLPTGERGNFRIISFETNFANGKQMEQVTVKGDGAVWKIRSHNYSPINLKQQNEDRR